MYPIDELFLVNQMRHKELIQESERERLSKLALKNQTGNQGLGSKIIEWIRAQLPEKGPGEESFYEQYRISNLCCTVTDSKSG